MKCILIDQHRSTGTSSSLTLQSLEIARPPVKTSYLAGDRFDKIGMLVMGTYAVDGIPMNIVDVTDNIDIFPEILTDGVDSVEISMITGQGQKIAVSQPVSVTHRLVSIKAEDIPLGAGYEYGSILPEQHEVTATYSDGQTAQVMANYQSQEDQFIDFIGEKIIPIKYTENGVTATTQFKIAAERRSTTKVSRKLPIVSLEYSGEEQSVVSMGSQLFEHYYQRLMILEGTLEATEAGRYEIICRPDDHTRWDDGTREGVSTYWVIEPAKISNVPVQSNSLTYNRSSQSPTWSNYDPEKLTISGETSGTNAGTYTVTFTPTKNYTWDDGSIDSKSVTWIIGKANRTLRIEPDSITFNYETASNNIELYFPVDPVKQPNKVIVNMDNFKFLVEDSIYASDDGPYDYEINVTDPFIDGVISNGEILLTVEESPNYLQSNTATLKVNLNFWEFGPGTEEEADATWFAGLKSYLASNNGASLKTTSGGSIVGCVKTVTLTSPVLSTATHKIRVIGVDQDGDNTVTFQTVNCLNVATSYCGSYLSWTLSEPYAECQNYYNAFPEPNAIKMVNKGTCEELNASRNGTPIYREQRVFILSERELGLDSYSPLSVANSTTIKAECTYGYNAAYSYFTSGASRVKLLGDDGIDMGQVSYWTRSRLYATARENDQCAVDYKGDTMICPGTNHSNNCGVAPAFVIG